MKLKKWFNILAFEIGGKNSNYTSSNMITSSYSLFKPKIVEMCIFLYTIFCGSGFLKAHLEQGKISIAQD